MTPGRVGAALDHRGWAVGPPDVRAALAYERGLLVAGKRIAVVYLARMKEPFPQFEAFAKSYGEHDAGIDHDLVIIVKGNSKIGERFVISSLFVNKPKLLGVSDRGVDVHAYLKAARLLDNEYLLFLNTFSIIQADRWLAKLAFQLFQPDVGIVGATGSYESLIDTFRFINKGTWLGGVKRIRYNEAVAKQFFSHFRVNYWDWVKPSTSLKRRIKRFVRDIRQNRPHRTKELDREFARVWHQTTRSSNLTFLNDFPSFPNPHIRSNAFGISRQLLLDFGFRLAPTKNDANRFESGADSLTRRIRASGKRAVIVGADGVGYDVEDWPKSGTFRLGHQENVLVADNQVRAFEASSAWERAAISLMSWGDSIGKSELPLDTLGCRFEADGFSLRAPNLRRPSVRPKFSVVIPTHNRPDLISEAVETVKRQSYEEWELIVFDNASSVPTSECVDLRDHRIRSSRSDTSLPVTESWNTAIDLAQGDYITLIGDDDGLLPSYFHHLQSIVSAFDEPDVVYSSILQFLHPGVAPWQRFGYVADVRNGFFFENRGPPFRLSREDALKSDSGSLDLRRNFTFNMQAFSFRRDFLETLRSDGKIFLSPFPDYYLANVAFGLAKSIAVEPRPLVIAGVSRSSFGYTMFNNLEKKGAELLKTDLEEDCAYRALRSRLLPGPAYNTNYVVTMQHVANRLGSAVPAVNIERYRQLQIFSVMTSTRDDLKQSLLSGLSPAELRFAAHVAKLSARGDKAKLTEIENATKMVEFEALQDMKDVGSFDSAIRVFEAVETGALDLLLLGKIVSD
jgi:glycosyltransferase involved in cell wall biosynthesis